MLNNKKFNALFEEKKEYSFIKTREEIKEYINKDSEGNIINLKLELKNFDYFTSKEVKKVMIYFAVYNEDTKEYLDYSTFSNKDKNEEIILSKHCTIIKEINQYINFDANLLFKFLIVPLIEENKEYLFSLEKYFYKSENFNIDKSEENINKVKLTFSMMFYKVLPLFILILIPANIYNFLINNLGFVDSLIDISTITTSFIYLLNGTINFVIKYIIYFFIGMIIFIPIYAIITIYFGFYFSFFISKIFHLIKILLYCEKNNQHEFILEKINFKRAIKDTLPILMLFKSFKYYLLSSLIYTLIIIFLTISFFISQIIDTNNNNNKINTVISIGAYQYMQYSAFPKISKIKYKNDNYKDRIVLFMGYDKAYSYYYDIDYINNILSSYKKEEIDKFIKDNNDSITFENIFRVLLVGKINNINIKAIKNDMYEFFNIDNSEINSNVFSEKREIELQEKKKL